MSGDAMKLAARELPAPDPTQPTADVVIDGEIYRLCFDTLALAEAEEEMIRQGLNICLLVELPRLTIRSVVITFAAAAHKYQPSLTYDDVVKLLTPPHLSAAANGIVECWNKCRAPKEQKAEGGAEELPNPPEPS
jgi:hypothetical protein